MSRILILYATSHGQTHRIADAIADRLRARGHVVELADAGAGGRCLPPPADYDAVVLGSRIQFGHHARAIGAYVRAHRAALDEVTSAFFSVSMSASEPGSGTDPSGYLRNFFDEHAWHPPHAIALGGALPYRQYGPILRFVMKQISRAAHHTTDTSRDHDFTDWDAVTRFADQLADELEPRAQPSPTRRARARVLA